MLALAGFVGSLLAAAAEPPDAAAQAHQFAAAFTAKYGNRHPNWTEDSWLNAAVVAHQQYKFLFVYLHSPEHENTGAYVRNVLTSPEVVEYVNEHFVSWGGDVRQPDAFGLSGRLNISTYPAVVLLAFSGTRTKLVAAAQGLVSKQQLLAVLRRVVEEQGMMLTAERLEREERVSASLCYHHCLQFALSSCGGADVLTQFVKLGAFCKHKTHDQVPFCGPTSLASSCAGHSIQLLAA